MRVALSRIAGEGFLFMSFALRPLCHCVTSPPRCGGDTETKALWNRSPAPERGWGQGEGYGTGGKDSEQQPAFGRVRE